MIRYVWKSSSRDRYIEGSVEDHMSALSKGGSDKLQHGEVAVQAFNNNISAGQGRISVEWLLELAKSQQGRPMTPEINAIISKRASIVQKKFAQALHSVGPDGFHTRPATSLHRLFKDTVSSASRFALEEREKSRSMLLHKANAHHFEALTARHGGVIETMTEIFAGRANLNSAEEEVLLEDLYEEEIALSILLQHGASLTNRKYPHAHGVVRVNESVQDILNHSVTLVTALAGHNYSNLALPLIEVSPHAADSFLTCIPSVVEFTVVEALKNAVYATIQKHGKKDKEVPPVVIEVSQHSHSTLRIDILDEGPGICPAVAKTAFTFAGATSTSAMVDEQTSYQPVSSPLCGFHVGIFLLNRFLLGTNSGSFKLENRTDRKHGALARITFRIV